MTGTPQQSLCFVCSGSRLLSAVSTRFRVIVPFLGLCGRYTHSLGDPFVAPIPPLSQGSSDNFCLQTQPQMQHLILLVIAIERKHPTLALRWSASLLGCLNSRTQGQIQFRPHRNLIMRKLKTPPGSSQIIIDGDCTIIELV